MTGRLTEEIPEPRDMAALALVAEAKREEDARTIRAYAKKHGKPKAMALARALKWSAADFEALFARKPKDRPEAEAAADDGRPPSEGAGDAPPADDGPRWIKAQNPVKPVPADFPVRPLGVSSDPRDPLYHYLNPLGQLRSLNASDHSAAGLKGLLAPKSEALWEVWPKFNLTTNKQDGFKADRASESLMKACAARGVFDAEKRVRGVGAWRAEDGSITLHAGDGVQVAGVWKDPGEHGGYLYTRQEATPRPDPALREDWRDLIGETLTKLDSWNWRDEARAPALGHCLGSVLLFAWMAGSTIGGALRWRPMIWITGEAGSGKSSLFDLIVAVLGDLLKIEDATEASVRGANVMATRPVLLDEVENDPNSRRGKALMDLAKIAASGGRSTRSSSDHKVVEFVLRSPFMFSSVLIPPMAGPIVSRFCILDVDRIEKARGLTLDAPRLAATGRVMRRRMLDGWARFEETLALWRGTMAEFGHDARGADTFGYLLAFVDLALWDEPADVDTRRAVAACLSREAIEAKSGGSDGTRAMLDFVGSFPLDAFRGGTKFTIGSLTAAACGLTIGDGSSIGTPEGCREILRERGIYVNRDWRTRDDFPDGPPDNWSLGQYRVALPNRHEGLRQIFANSNWHTGSGMTGVWVQAMRRLPGVLAENSRRLGGRGWSVPAEVFLQLDESTG